MRKPSMKWGRREQGSSRTSCPRRRSGLSGLGWAGSGLGWPDLAWSGSPRLDRPRLPSWRAAWLGARAVHVAGCCAAGARGPGTTQAGRKAPAQARSGPVQVASSDPPRGQLVRELSRARQSRFVDGFLVCTRRLVAAVVVVTHELLEVDSEVPSSRNGLSKI